MLSLRLPLLALVALALATTASASSASLEHHRRQAQAADHHRRSFDVAGPKRMTHRRATQVQIDAQAHLVRIADAFADSNSKWQQAAIKSLTEGKTPQTYDEWYESQGGDQGDSQPKSQPKPKASHKHKHKSGTKHLPTAQAKPASKPESESKPEAQQQQQQQQQPKPAPKPAQEQPKPKPQEQPKPTPQEQPKPKPSNNNSDGGSSGGGLLSGLIQVVSGDATYYSAGLGACGQTNSDNDYIVAAGQSLFDRYLTDGNPNNNPLCNKRVKLTYKGKSLTARITDRCPGCTAESLDLTPKLFQDLIGDMGLGRVTITWGFVDALP